MNSKCIAWIEDDIDILMPLETYLKKDGLEFKEYRSYAEAIKHIDEIATCDLILLDIILPPGDDGITGDYLGLDLLSRLRNEFQINVPVIALSLIANSRDVVKPEELLKLNAYPLDKFTDLAELRSEVRRHLGMPPV